MMRLSQMLKQISCLVLWALVCLLNGCTPFPAANEQRYQLTASGSVASVSARRPVSLMVMQPEALAGYDTEQMLYVSRPFQVSPFAQNQWMSPPATMIFPLQVHSLESSHYFYAVASDPNIGKTDYRLESKLIRLQQNFLVKPSQVQLVMQVLLVQVNDNRIVATETFEEMVNCPKDSPLGGVIAANQAIQKLTARITRFVIHHVTQDLRSLR